MQTGNAHKFPPNINPQLYAWLACTIGSLCVGDYDANEQNSFGNWLILVGQFILTNAAQQQLIESRFENNNININSKKHKSGGGIYTSDSNTSNQTQRSEVEFLLDAIDKIYRELEEICNVQNDNGDSSVS